MHARTATKGRSTILLFSESSFSEADILIQPADIGIR